MKKVLFALLAAAGLSPAAQVFTIGSGALGNQENVNNWPSAESPPNAIDGNSATKYLNFAHPLGDVNDYNSGYIFTPTAGAATVIGINFTTANDSPERDPASYVLYGSNNALAAASTTVGASYSVDALFTQISAGPLALPAARLTAGTNVAFSNATAYQTFLLVFPTVANPSANSMQIAEARLQTAGGDLDSAGTVGGGRITSVVVPEPATGVFGILGALGLATRRRRA